MRSLFSPLLPDDYLELVNPLWSTQELRGRIERIERETDSAVTVFIRPGYDWPGHKAGQYTRVGVVVDGVFHWRAYSLTSEPDHPQGYIAITPKRVDEGVVSPYLTNDARPGDIVRLGGVEGDFVLPDEPPQRLLFISAGSGVTPIMSMLRSLERIDAVADAVHLHSAPHRGRRHLRPPPARAARARVGLPPAPPGHRQERSHGPGRPRRPVPGLARARSLPLGPQRDARRHDRALGARGRLRPPAHGALPAKLGLGGGEEGEGGEIAFVCSDAQAESDGSKPILVAGEEAGLELPFGCREGICHTCIGKLCSGQVRDLRNGRVYGQDGEMVRTCISAPEGRVEIEL